MSTIRELDEKYIMHTYKRFPVEIVRGEGSLAYGSDGKRYIDLGSGIAVNAFGFADSVWKSAVTTQLGKIQHTSNLYYTEPCAKLAEVLCEKSGMSRVFFSNSGAEANECLIKGLRKYAAETRGEDCYKIITLKNSFHGRTLTTLAATGQDVFHELFRPLTPGFINVSNTDIEEMMKAVSEENIAGVMIEIIQGEGGVVPLDKTYLRELSELLKRENIPLAVDEVQTGNGRTGKYFSYMHYGLSPDIVSTAKGLGGGLPIGAALFSEKMKNVLTYGEHGSTFGGNPVASAGALSIVSRIDDALMKDVVRKGERIRSRLLKKPGIKEISGLGLMLGIECERPVAELIEALIKRGVLCLSAKKKLRLLPALNIPDDLIDEACGIIAEEAGKIS